MKSPVTMHSTGRACDILIPQFGRGVEGMGQYYRFDSKNSQITSVQGELLYRIDILAKLHI